MAKKKNRRTKTKRKQARQQLPDSRVMEGVLSQLVSTLQGEEAPDSPLAKAQALMYQAFDASSEQRQIQLARKALEISSDCADAYVLLADLATSHKEAKSLYEQAVAAGERALGPEAFQQYEGHFWGAIATRPYMRARLGLAQILWSAGHREEAVGHLQDLLRLNPQDNQGIRYMLARLLLNLDRDNHLEQLLRQYDENTSVWMYTRALLAFRRRGDTAEARELLNQARMSNKHVLAYLCGEEFPPPERPGYYSPGDRNEAIEYAGSFRAAWKDTAGAIAWLRACGAKKRSNPSPPKGPDESAKKKLNKNLVQELDVWQAEFRQMPNWIEIEGEIVRPWTVLVTSRSDDLVLGHQITEEMPTLASLWDILADTMRRPAAGKAHRPTELQVRSGAVWQALIPHLAEVGVRLVESDELDHVDFLFENVFTQMCGEPRPGLLDVPGSKPALVAGFFEAAASYFRQAPWKKIADGAPIRIDCDKFQSGPWFAVVMGQAGMTAGLALYQDLSALRGMYERDMTDEERARETVATSVTFGEEWTIPIADVEAAKKFGWQVARDDAYPEVIHKERGLSIRPPLAWELELIEGCLRAVPEYVHRHTLDESAAETIEVPTASGRLSLRLSWADMDA